MNGFQLDTGILDFSNQHARVFDSSSNVTVGPENKLLRLFLYIYSKNDERFVLGNYDYTQGGTIPLLTTVTGFPVATIPMSCKTTDGTDTTYEGFGNPTEYPKHD